MRIGILALLSFTLAAVPLAFSTRTYEQFELPQTLLLRLLVPMMLALTLARFAMGRKWNWQRTPMDAPVLLWAGWLLFKTVLSVSPALSWSGEYENHDGAFVQLHYIVLFFLVTQNVRHWEEARRVIRAFVLGSVVASIYVLLQASGLDFLAWSVSFRRYGRFSGTLGNPLIAGSLAMLALPLGLAYLRPRDGSSIRRSLLLLGTVSVAGVGFWLALFLRESGSAPFFSSLEVAASLPSFWTLAAFAALLIAQGACAVMGRLGLARILACSALSILFLRTLLDSGSRGAVLGLVGGLLFATALLVMKGSTRARWKIGWPAAGRHRPLVRIALPLLIAAVALVALPGTSSMQRLAETFSHPGRELAESRLVIWLPALEMWKARPLTGWGVDSFMSVFTAFQPGSSAPDQMVGLLPQTAHCEPLHVLATLGLVGLALWIGLLVIWFRTVYRKFATSDADERLHLAIVCGAVIAYLIQALLGITAVPIRGAFWALLALAVVSGRAAFDEARASPVGKGARSSARWTRLALWPVVLALPIAAGAAVTSLYRADVRYNDAFARLEWVGEIQGATSFTVGPLAAREMVELEARLPFGDALLEEQFRDLREAAVWIGKQVRAGSESRERLQEMSRSHDALVLLLSAVVHQRDAVRLASREPRFFQFMGDLYTELYRWSSAVERRQNWFERGVAAYRRAVELNPRNAFSTASLARLWYLHYRREGITGSFERAERLYRNALELAPVNPEFLTDFVNLYLSAGKIDPALDVASGVESRDPPLAGTVFLDIGKKLAGVSDRQSASGGRDAAAATRIKAIDALREAERILPDRAEVPYRQAMLHCAAGEDQLCRSLLEKALAIDPGYEPALAEMP